MAERRGVVIKLYGDPTLSGAIADGMSKALSPAQIEVVKAEIDRQHIARLVRVAVGNGNTAEDYQCMIIKARHDYGKYYRQPGPLQRVGDALLGVYALIVCGISAAYRSQERVLGGGR